MPLDKKKFTIKRNDTLPNLIVNVIDRGCLYEKQSFSLSGVTGVTFSMLNTDCDYHKISLKEAQIQCVSGGTIQYIWDPEDTNESGNYLGEFELTFTGGGKMSIPQIGGINIEIVDDISMG
jgi:hypothetical protein